MIFKLDDHFCTSFKSIDFIYFHFSHGLHYPLIHNSLPYLFHGCYHNAEFIHRLRTSLSHLVHIIISVIVRHEINDDALIWIARLIQITTVATMQKRTEIKKIAYGVQLTRIYPPLSRGDIHNISHILHLYIFL